MGADAAGGVFGVRARPEAELVTPDDKAKVLRERYEERAAMGEYHGGLSREEAERQAALEVYGAEEPPS